MVVTVVVIDSFGLGALPDAAAYGDVGANTIANICRRIPGPKWPELSRLGLGNAAALLGTVLPGCPVAERPTADYGVLGQRSAGKDSTTGHWELAGIVLDQPFAVFPKGPPSFPAKLVQAIETETGVSFIGNVAASGTHIIAELGAEHLRTGCPICYTSVDSVFQIAAHDSVFPRDRLYELCAIARRHCDRYRIARVIARPFTGEVGAFRRTAERRDFSMIPPEPNLLSRLQNAGCTTVGIGKIGDMFADRGLDFNFKDSSNRDCLSRTEEVLIDRGAGTEPTFLFVNLVETDMYFGHRRDVRGYFEAVQEIDAFLPRLTALVAPGDALIITADHGCDPTFPGSDHTREYVPFLSFEPGKVGESLGVGEGHTAIADVVLRRFGL